MIIRFLKYINEYLEGMMFFESGRFKRHGEMDDYVLAYRRKFADQLNNPSSILSQHISRKKTFR